MQPLQYRDGPGIVLVLLFAGSSADTPTVASQTGDTPNPAVGSTNPDVPMDPSALSAATSGASKAIARRPVETSTQPVEPPTEVVAGNPLALKRIPTDARLWGFQLPQTTWSAAYDEQTGRLAVTNDSEGIVVYDVNKLMQGQNAFVGSIPTNGLPLAVCAKVLPERRVFIVSSDGTPTVQIFGVTTLERLGTILLDGVRYADFQATSLNVNDPFVHYSNENMGADGSSQANRTTQRIGRVNVADLSHESFAGEDSPRMLDFAVSAAGDRIYGRISEESAFVGSYISSDGKGSLKADRSLRRGLTHGIAINPDNQQVALDSFIVNTSLRYPFGWAHPTERRKDHDSPAYYLIPKAFFRDMPLCFGVSPDTTAVFFASTNTLLSAIEIPLPQSWKQHDHKTKASPDIRWRKKSAGKFASYFLWGTAADQRKRGVLVFSDHIVVAPLQGLNLPPEPMLAISSALPPQVPVDQPLELPVNVDPEGAQVQFFVPPASDRGNRMQPPLGAAQPANESRRNKSEIHLNASVGSTQKIIYVSDVGKIAGRPLPFQIRIDEEVMSVTGIDDFKDALLLERADGVGHSVTARIEILDGSEPEIANLPEVRDNLLVWTPSTDELGTQLVVLKLSLGKLSREICWEVDVQHPSANSAPLPMHVTGVYGVDENEVVVWGTQKNTDGAGMQHMVAVLDLKAGTLSHTQVLPHHISAVAQSKNQLFVAMREDIRGNIGPGAIAVLDADSLEITNTLPIPHGVGRLTVIADQMLLGTSFQSHENGCGHGWHLGNAAVRCCGSGPGGSLDSAGSADSG